MADDLISIAARRKLGAPTEWRFKSSTMIGAGSTRAYLIRGGVPRPLTRGPRKGQLVFDGVTLDEVVIAPEELDAAR